MFRLSIQSSYRGCCGVNSCPSLSAGVFSGPCTGCRGVFMVVDSGQAHRVEGITFSSGILIPSFCHLTFTPHTFLSILHLSRAFFLLSLLMPPDAVFSLKLSLRTTSSVYPPTFSSLLPNCNDKHCILIED
ncbi:hypothetical protein XENOCAPTIV_000945 [Xenoophorus captivus]|uniref:Uncharacterized protein n=1 Tax=Xenoophorus captivus TaxID=1517983 RepID=A0ABV0Q7B3_9TELE